MLAQAPANDPPPRPFHLSVNDQLYGKISTVEKESSQHIVSHDKASVAFSVGGCSYPLLVPRMHRSPSYTCMIYFIGIYNFVLPSQNGLNPLRSKGSPSIFLPLDGEVTR